MSKEENWRQKERTFWNLAPGFQPPAICSPATPSGITTFEFHIPVTAEPSSTSDLLAPQPIAAK